MKSFLTLLLCFMLCLVPVSAFAAFTDVPDGHWAEETIAQAVSADIITGVGEGRFGLGQQVKRSEFAAMLVRMMQWETVVPQEPSFSDVPMQAWYFENVETLRAGGAAEAESRFRPEENITREEMAVMLIRAIGFSGLAEQLDTAPFADVTEHVGFISLAYDFGILNGKSADSFDPKGYALREEAAAMMMRLHEKYTHKLDWLHGFYAISSWSQREMAAQMDAVSFGWSRLEYDVQKGVWLNTTGENGNDWRIPDGAEEAISYLKENGVKRNLGVMMNTSMEVELTDGTRSNACREVLTNAQNRSDAAAQIAAAARDYDGVTVDFEGMSGEALKNGLNEFLKELRTQIGDKLLYTAVHPVTDGGYFDAYDYRTIGEISNRVILMAHDYAALRMDENLRAAGFTTTPVTPIASIYTALKAVTDSDTGVRDYSKIVLALSLSSSAAWQLQNGAVTNEYAIHPAMATIQKRLLQPGTEIAYHSRYCNPSASYFDDDGNRVILWYEDSRSVADKIKLARMLGIHGLSVWRIGVIPNVSDASVYYNVWDTILAQK